MNANWIQHLISMAPAQGGDPAQQGNPYSSLILLAAMFAIFYFVLIRPQQKRVKEHQQMVSNLQKGAEVVTTGGLIGRITNIADDVVTLDVGNNVKIKFQKASIQQVVSAKAQDEKGE